MKRLWIGTWAALVLWAGAAAAFAAEPLDLSAAMNAPIGMHVSVLQEEAAPLSLQEARQALADGRFQAANHPMMNFGIGANPVWLAFRAQNPTSRPLDRRILVETSWIDQIDLYVEQPGGTVDHQRVGDTLAFAERPMESRYFDLPHAFQPGRTVVFMRVQSPDPMALPIYVVSPRELDRRTTVEAYTYGILYGGLGTLLVYNFFLFVGLRRQRYAYYSLYLACFIAMNLAYTGHGYRWLWPESPQWQMWSNPVLMVVYALSGLLFVIRFLQTKHHFPRLHRVLVISMTAFAVLEGVAILAGSHVGALLVAFVFVLYFSPTMVVLGAVAVLHRITSAKFFLIAALAGIVGATSTALTVWGFVPYTVLGYRLVEVGLMIDAVLLALALADQFRVSQEQKARAEALARIDPLTELNNRRGFHELAAPVWVTGVRHNRGMSVVVLDLDHFKAFNDTYGHNMGDKMLVMVAQTVKRLARVGDIAARWGGEEFLLFLPETEHDGAMMVANRLREEIKAMRLNHKGKELFITASLGVAERQDGTISLESLIESADQGLYAAKRQGRDRVCAV